MKVLVATKPVAEFRAGQYFILDDYDETYVTGEPVQVQRGKFIIVPSSRIARPYSEIRAAVTEVKSGS